VADSGHKEEGENGNTVRTTLIRRLLDRASYSYGQCIKLGESSPAVYDVYVKTLPTGCGCATLRIATLALSFLLCLHIELKVNDLVMLSMANDRRRTGQEI
jgi:hypothetical protein